MKRFAIAVVALVALSVPHAATADTGTITGVTHDGTTVSIQGVEVYLDSCPMWSEYSGAMACGAEVGLVPASQTCPAGGVGMLHVWSALRAATGTDRTMKSGPLSKPVPERVQYRVCVYRVYTSQNYGETIGKLAETLTPYPPPLPAPPATPPATNPPASLAPPPSSATAETRQPQLQARKAKASAKAILARKFGKRWRKGSKRKVACSRRSATKMRCRASWRYAGKRRKATIVVTLTNGQPKARVL